jgi:hypothetical protein
MSDDSKRPTERDAPQPAHNPENEFPTRPEDVEPNYGRNVSGDEAKDAGAKATDETPLSRDEVIDQAAYKDDSADVGLRAGDAEKETDSNR